MSFNPLANTATSRCCQLLLALLLLSLTYSSQGKPDFTRGGHIAIIIIPAILTHRDWDQSEIKTSSC